MARSSDPSRRNPFDVRAATQTERVALANRLDSLTDAQWAQPSLCGDWSVEQVVAHLTAAASSGPLRWMGSVIRARFDFDEHNARRMVEQRGATPAETLAKFQTILTSTTSPFGPSEAWLGEVVVHSQDILRPLGIAYTPPIVMTTHLARFLARTNFTVASKKAIHGLHLEAVDGPFSTGVGPQVSGPTIALVMAMAGRETYCDDLTGPGVDTLRARSQAAGPRS